MKTNQVTKLSEQIKFYSIELSRLHDEYNESILNEKFEKVTELKNYINKCNSLINEKQNEIELLQMRITNLTKLENLFYKIEKDLIERLEGFDVLGSYKNILKEVVSLDDNIFEMLYDSDTENYQEYMIDESVEYFQSQISDSYYQLQKYFK